MSKFFPYNQATTQLTTAEKVGQLFMPAAFINDSEEEIQNLEQLIANYHIGGICFFHSRASAATNYEGKKDVIYNEHSFDTLKRLIERYQKCAKYPLLIAIDAEWGLVMRIENTPQYPYSITLGAIQNSEDLINKVGQNIAQDCKAAGIHWNFAPVADINNNPNNPVIGYRSFGEEKLEVTKNVLAFTKGMQGEGILTSVKHFPGHGDTATDSHLGLPLIDKSRDELDNNELHPFQRAIDNGVDSVMVGHLSVPAITQSTTIPTSISKKAIKEVLRKEMGFTGVVVSDALNMHAVSKMFDKKGELEWAAFDAGNDVLCFAESVTEGIEKIKINASENQVEESFERVWKLKERAFKAMRTKKISKLTHAAPLNKELAKGSLTLFKGDTSWTDTFHNEGFMGIEISKNSDNLFFKLIQNKYKFSNFSTATNTVTEINDSLRQCRNVLVALLPPKVKPQNNFDISDEEITFLNSLMAQKNVILYLFGNPYVLNLIEAETAKVIVIAYQDFKTFQENAAHHFLGEVVANGILPVTINKEMV